LSGVLRKTLVIIYNTVVLGACPRIHLNSAEFT
jgi:hypothetical protein